METRKKALLSVILEEYIRTARPVGSSLIVDKYYRELSSATIRHEMLMLEQEGYLTHPHTSAGRIPTEKGYRFYIKNFLKEKQLTPVERQVIEQIIGQHYRYHPDLIKHIAKALAELSQETVIVGFSPDDVYYTGLSHVFKKPEFADLDLICDFSEVVDRLDVIMHKLFKQIDDRVSILIGHENPFGEMFATIVTKYHAGGNEGMVGILGPMRMDYVSNSARLKYIQEKIKP